MQLKNARVLVTGADGFIGSHLVEALLDAGARVRAFCYYNSFQTLGWLDTLPPERLGRIEIMMGDVRDPGRVREAVSGMDAVFHLAALIGIPYSYRAPESYVDTNIRGTLHVLEAARVEPRTRVFVTSTSEVYGTAQTTPITEEHPRQPQSPYSATKIAADCLAESFARSFEQPVTIVRPFNTYGPRQSARAVIPTIAAQLLSGSRRLTLGALAPKRDFTYVTDTCAAFVAIASSDATIGKEYNVASGAAMSIEAIAEKFIAMICPGQSVEIVSDVSRLRPEKSEVMELLGSSEKLCVQTGWRPTVDVDAGLSQTLAWIRENLQRYRQPLDYHV